MHKSDTDLTNCYSKKCVRETERKLFHQGLFTVIAVVVATEF